MSAKNPTTTDASLLEERLEYLRTMLPYCMAELRDSRSLTQTDLAKRLGLNQPAVSKIESDKIDSDLTTIVRYLDALDADLVLAVRKREGELIQVTDDYEYVLVDLRRSLVESLPTDNCLSEYVESTLAHYGACSHGESKITVPERRGRRWIEDVDLESREFENLSDDSMMASVENYDAEAVRRKPPSNVVNISDRRNIARARG